VCVWGGQANRRDPFTLYVQEGQSPKDRKDKAALAAVLDAAAALDVVSARWVTLRARRVTLRARWVTLKARG
jgi:hypothetical protein